MTLGGLGNEDETKNNQAIGEKMTKSRKKEERLSQTVKDLLNFVRTRYSLNAYAGACYLKMASEKLLPELSPYDKRKIVREIMARNYGGEYESRILKLRFGLEIDPQPFSPQFAFRKNRIRMNSIYAREGRESFDVANWHLNEGRNFAALESFKYAGDRYKGAGLFEKARACYRISLSLGQEIAPEIRQLSGSLEYVGSVILKKRNYISSAENKLPD